METTLTAPNSLMQFKMGVDSLLEKRDYFVKKILPKLIEGQDFYVIKGRKSLAKGGAEKLAAIYQMVATFQRDTDTIESFRNVEGLVAYVCTLNRLGSGDVAGQGRGAATYKAHNNDANKTIKMAQKSAFIDAVIRATGLSDIFTSDLEDMPLENITAAVPERRVESVPDTNYFPKNQEQAADEPSTEKQKKLLVELCYDRIRDKQERERWLSEIETLSKFDASEMISSFLMGARR